MRRGRGAGQSWEDEDESVDSFRGPVECKQIVRAGGVEIG